MLSVSVKRLYYVTDKVIVRNLRSRGRKFVPDANPGLQRRIDEFQKQGLKVEDEDAEEFIEESASDFYNVGEAYSAHVKDTKASKTSLIQNIIKEKYFKVNLPNLLTWSEKEQIRHLAAKEPDEWTPEKIAESFPVTPAVVQKLLKYPWKPATKERIARHDASAMRNWKELKEGTLKIPEDLCQHCLKFSERTIPPLSQKSVKIDLTQETNMGEFEKIIRRCAARDEKSQTTENSRSTKSSDENSDEESPKLRKYSKIVTLDQLVDKVKKRLDKGNEVDLNDSIMLDTIKSTDNKPDTQNINLNKEIELSGEENKASELTHYKENDSKDTLEIDYTQRIRIPKKAYKKGATYKINDCYYDDDGRFLYRVLGLTK